MTFLERIECLKRLHQLIHRRATGAPAQLAIKLEVSESTVYALLTEAKELGALFRYNRTLQSYEYLHQTQFQIGFSSLESIKIIGVVVYFLHSEKFGVAQNIFVTQSKHHGRMKLVAPVAEKGQ